MLAMYELYSPLERYSGTSCLMKVRYDCVIAQIVGAITRWSNRSTVLVGRRARFCVPGSPGPGS
jgi:hypothetical protein